MPLHRLLRVLTWHLTHASAPIPVRAHLTTAAPQLRRPQVFPRQGVAELLKLLLYASCCTAPTLAPWHRTRTPTLH
jgi:hypothetical protein